MARIVPKLNLNKTPQLVENNSLIFAKNIRILKDNTIGPDTSLEEVETNIGVRVEDEDGVHYEHEEYIAEIVGLNNKIYFIKEDSTAEPSIVKIFEYDEVTNTFRTVECAWHYSGGEITGCVSVNGTGEYILTICEYNTPNGALIPIKHININKCSINDDESTYTQAPNIPISNLRLSGRYVKNIPAGVYQFFIRYKIHDEFYTNWFPCSKELFAGSRKVVDTLQGSLKHTDLHEDSNNSFVFTIEHLYPQFCANYEQFQLGFIISADGGVFARSWKHFDMSLASTDSIYFDYNKGDIEDINIDDLLKTNYDIFNVKNIAQYKNRLYVANYTETDFNDAGLQYYAKQVRVNFDLHNIEITSGYYLNNIPLSESINGVYDSFDNVNVNSIYYDAMYCNSVTTLYTTNTETLTLGTLPANAVDAQGNPLTPQFPATVNPEIVKVFMKGSDDTVYNIAEYESLLVIDNENQDTIINTVIDDVKTLILGIDANGNFKIQLNDTILTISSFYIEYYSYGPVEKERITEDVTIDDHDITRVFWEYTRKKYTKQLKVEVALKSNLLSTTYAYNEYNTFLPFTKYDFYIHYVTQNGIVTNGYFLGTKEVLHYIKGYKPAAAADVPPEIVQLVTQRLPGVTYITNLDDITDLALCGTDVNEWAWYEDGSHSGRYFRLQTGNIDTPCLIVPEFTNIVCPPGYVGCFFSVTKYGNNVAEGYNYSYEYDSVGNKTTHKVDCLDLNCLLYNINSNIKIKNSNGETITEFANYYASGTTNPIDYLGGSGHVEFTTDNETPIDSKCWIIVDDTGRPYKKQLLKVTPFIKLFTEEPRGYLALTDLNAPGYFCEVVTLRREYCDGPNGYYVSGSDIYNRAQDSDDPTGSSPTVELNDERVEYHTSEKNYIFSNYNLNYVSLTSDLTPIIRRYKVKREGDTEEGMIESSNKQFITLVNSLLASYSLELKSFFKDYTRKLYQEYTKNNIVEFNNTIRVSSIDIDEVYRYIFKFEATDYYNVPTNRGIITNLISIANSLYVHCEHSLFKFTDNKTLNAQEEEVTLQENDIFNSGISEVFDAQYGYAGLSDRKQSLITYNAYVFYDAVAKVIYAFGGEQQIANIGESIQKLIDTINPIDVRFVGDELNDRFFINLRNSNGNVCLSFNFKTKSFVSIHDVDFRHGFHSRRHSYFLHDNKDEDDIINGWSIYRITDKINIDDTNNYIVYQNCYTPSLLSIEDQPTTEGINVASACIDVVTNVEYEKIKALNYINWICSDIQDYGINFNYVGEENLNRLYAGDKIRIYSDSTSTDLFDLVDENGKAKISNEQRNIDNYGNPITVKGSWQYPKYNCGVFSMNYFRDIIKTGNIYNDVEDKDLFKYKISTNTGSNRLVDLTERAQRLNLTQENALVYGKYFVLRLIFINRNFKIENVTFRMSDYGKTK